MCFVKRVYISQRIREFLSLISCNDHFGCIYGVTISPIALTFRGYLNRAVACWDTRILLSRRPVRRPLHHSRRGPAIVLPSTDGRTLLRMAREGYGMLIQRDFEGNQMATPQRKLTNPASLDKQN